ncbi:MAG: DNA-binding protein [archaeon]|nr:DNA-binding protein [archaeon]
MKSVELGKGRVFVLTIDTDESIKGCIEEFCKSNGIKGAKVTILGGIQRGSTFVCGPSLTNGEVGAPIKPLTYTTDAPTEFLGVGTIFLNEDGEPVMHLHGTLGRQGMSVTGCFRERALAWLTMEVIIEELVGDLPVRVMDKELCVAPLVIR